MSSDKSIAHVKKQAYPQAEGGQFSRWVDSLRASFRPAARILTLTVRRVGGGDLVREDMVDECRCCSQTDDAPLPGPATSGIRLATASAWATYVTSLSMSDPRMSTVLAVAEALGVKIGDLAK